MNGARLLVCSMLALGACVVQDTTPVNPGYGYGTPATGAPTDTTVGAPGSQTVASSPPEKLYEQMTPSPGYGYVWLDGYWHWNGYEWAWVNGRWERQQEGLVYVEPFYDYVAGQYVYTPGYWSRPERLPHGWNRRPMRDGRPTIVAPPQGYHAQPRAVSPHPVHR